MKTLFTKKSHTIGAGQTISGAAAHAQTLRIVQGQVWVTVEGMKDDHWLEAGQSLEVAAGRLVVVEAGQCPSVIEAAANPVRRAQESGWTHFWAWLHTPRQVLLG